MTSYLHRSLWDVKSKRPLINERTPIGDVPRVWLEQIEPWVTRHGFNGCWISSRPINMRGQPVMHIKENGKWKNTTVAKFAMKIFWDFPDGYFIKHTCIYDQCVNPNHMYICPNPWGH